MNRESIALLLCLLVAAPIIGTVGAQENNSVDFTLDELKQDGPHQANSQDGVRMGQRTAYWAVYWPANDPFAEPGSPEGGEYLSPGHTLGRNSVYLRTWAYEDRQKTVHVVYWQKGTREIQRGNATTTEPYAKNVSHVTHEVTFNRGRPTVEIPLRQNDQQYQVTMWIEGEDFARWAFAHESIATTQSAGISSQGDYLISVITDFLLLIVFGGVVVGWACKKALDQAGIGPQYGYAPWMFGLTLLTGAAGLIAYETLANLIVNARYLLSLYVVGIIGIVILETYTTNVSSALFLRPTLEHAQSPTGDNAFDMLDGEAQAEKIVRKPDGTVSVVTPGLFPFLARVFGRSARLENVEQLRTRVPLDGKWDELFLADPEADELIHYSPESWTLSTPALTRENAAEYGIIGVGLAIAAAAIYTDAASTLAVGTVTLLGLAVWALTPIDGVAAVNPAPVHLRSAFASMIQYVEDVDDAKRFEEVKEQLDNERISKQRQIDREVANHDSTLVEGMVDPDGNVPAAVETDADEEIVDDRRSNGEVADDD